MRSLLARVPVTPVARCAAELACSAFLGFYHEPEKRWRSFPRAPRAVLYAVIFGGEERSARR